MTISTADVYDNERIEVLRNTETILDTYLQIIRSAESRWDYFADINSLSIVPFAIGSVKKAMPPLPPLPPQPKQIRQNQNQNQNQNRQQQ